MKLLQLDAVVGLHVLDERVQLRVFLALDAVGDNPHLQRVVHRRDARVLLDELDARDAPRRQLVLQQPVQVVVADDARLQHVGLRQHHGGLHVRHAAGVVGRGEARGVYGVRVRRHVLVLLEQLLVAARAKDAKRHMLVVVSKNVSTSFAEKGPKSTVIFGCS